MESDAEIFRVPVVVKLRPDGNVDLQVGVEKPRWAKKVNTSYLMFPEIGIGAVVYWKPKKLPYESPQREWIFQGICQAVTDAIYGPDPYVVPVDKHGNAMTPPELPPIVKVIETK